ncbi:MAG: polymerase subunit epsilon [Cellvibrio sp.]|nr:polymerase subunit epsilon [Cellvibrio sp.]
MQTAAQHPLIVITGAGGNIGKTLALALRKHYRVIGLDRSGGSSTEGNYDIDLSSFQSVQSTFEKITQKEGKDIAAVVHLAAYFDFTGEASPLYQTVNVAGTRHLLQVLQGFNVERFIYSSTMLVHKPGVPGTRIDENSPIEPGWAYPKSKAAAEAVIQQEAGKIPFTILRLAGIYDEHVTVPTLAQQIARIYERSMKAKLYAGDTNAGQAFLHKADMIDAFQRTIEQRNQLPQAHSLLIGEELCLSYDSLQNRIGELLHGEQEWKTINLPEPIAKAGAWLEEKTEPLVPDDFDKGEKPFIRPFMIDMASDHYELDIRRAKDLLHWYPRHSLDDTLDALITNLKQDPTRWYADNKITPPDWLTEASQQGYNPDKLLEQYQQQYQHQHRDNIWSGFMNIGLAGWLVCSAPRLDYAATPLAYSDIIAGSLLAIFAFISLSWRHSWARWVCATLGIWLLFAPLAFWAESAAAYLNNTLVGMLVIGFAVLTRPEPGVSPIAAMTGPTTPPGWSHNPSSWLQRMPIIILAFVGFFISHYLTAYQLDHIDGVVDPFFIDPAGSDKNGTEAIITSSLSEAWPVPDAGLGAMTYALEILVGMIGSTKRWRTMPWLVTLFGIMIVPLGIVSITFIIIQPILLDTWCTLCLIAAAAMLIQIPYSLDELIATAQFLKRRHNAGRPVLKIFFTGDNDETGSEQPADNFSQHPLAILRESFTGTVNLPWNIALCIMLGLWLMLTRISLGHEGNMANWDHLIGSLVITVAVCAMAEVARPARLLIIPLACALLITPFIYHVSTGSLIITLACALALIILSLPKGRSLNQFGTWNHRIV